MRHVRPLLTRATICVLSTLAAPACLALDDYQRGKQFGIGLFKLIASVVLLGILLRNMRSSDA